MRSNDVIKGLPHDIFCFTMLQEMVARMISVDLGIYKHCVGSLHLYDTDKSKAKSFMREGWQSTKSAMPPMPDGDPRPANRVCSRRRRPPSEEELSRLREAAGEARRTHTGQISSGYFRSSATGERNKGALYGDKNGNGLSDLRYVHPENSGRHRKRLMIEDCTDTVDQNNHAPGPHNPTQPNGQSGARRYERDQMGRARSIFRKSFRIHGRHHRPES